jgi:dihydrofolate synthase/folylpolyglutamate synthase
MESVELASRVKGYCRDVVVEPDIAKAIEIGLSRVSQHGVLLFTGSLYLVGRVRTVLHRHR